MKIEDIKIKLQSITEWLNDDLPTQSDCNMAKAEIGVLLEEINCGSQLSFEDYLTEEFLFGTQNYPEEYHKLFKEKFERAKTRFILQSKNN